MTLKVKLIPAGNYVWGVGLYYGKNLLMRSPNYLFKEEAERYAKDLRKKLRDITKGLM